MNSLRRWIIVGIVGVVMLQSLMGNTAAGAALPLAVDTDVCEVYDARIEELDAEYDAIGQEEKEAFEAWRAARIPIEKSDLPPFEKVAELEKIDTPYFEGKWARLDRQNEINEERSLLRDQQQECLETGEVSGDVLEQSGRDETPEQEDVLEQSGQDESQEHSPVKDDEDDTEAATTSGAETSGGGGDALISDVIPLEAAAGAGLATAAGIVAFNAAQTVRRKKTHARSTSSADAAATIGDGAHKAGDLVSAAENSTHLSQAVADVKTLSKTGQGRGTPSVSTPLNTPKGNPHLKITSSGVAKGISKLKKFTGPVGKVLSVAEISAAWTEEGHAGPKTQVTAGRVLGGIAGAQAGATSFALLGAGIGSLAGPVGMVVGGGVGAVIGAFVGAEGGSNIGEGVTKGIINVTAK